MTKKIITVLLSIGVCIGSVYAEPKAPDFPKIDLDHYAGQAAKQQNQVKLDEIEKAAKNMPKAPDIQLDKKGMDLDVIVQQYKQQFAVKKQQERNLMVFVSFSVPEKALLNLAKQAKKIDAVLVFRGVKGGLQQSNWTVAMKAIKPLADTGASVIIHPDAFKQFDIKQVPAFVLSNQDAKSCSDNKKQCEGDLKAFGDVSLEYVLDHWSRQDKPLAKVAEAKLQQLRGAE